MHRFVSASEAAGILGVTRETARHLAASDQIEAIRTSAGWVLDADAVAREAAIRRKFDRVNPDEAQRMLASFSGSRRDEMASVLELLADQPVTASTARDDEDNAGFDSEFVGLYPPRSQAEKLERRELAEHIAASRPQGEDGELTDEDWARIFPPGSYER